MSFEIPDIRNANLLPRTPRDVDPGDFLPAFAYDRSAATYGRVIWGFGRGSDTLSTPAEHPSRPLLLQQKDEWQPLVSFPLIMPGAHVLGPGPRNWISGSGGVEFVSFWHVDDKDFEVRMTLDRVGESELETVIGGVEYDETTLLARISFDFDVVNIVRGGLYLVSLDVRHALGDTGDMTLWSGCLCMSDVVDIEPPEPAGFLPDPEAMYAAFSLRKVVESYTGPCIEITRESDEETLDVGFDAEGNADTAAMLAFLDSENDTLRVTKWYDQGPNGRDAEPLGVLSTQGRIYLGAGTSVSGDISTGLQYRDGVLGVLYTHGMGNGQLATTADGNSIEEFTIFLIQRRDDDFGAGSGTRGFSAWFHTNASFLGYNRGSSGGLRDRHRARFAGVTRDAPAGKFEQWDTTQLMCDSMFSGKPSDDWFVHRNGEFVNSEERTATYQLSRIWLGRTNANGSQPRGWLTEAIFYEKQFSAAEREDIEESIMDHYGITPVPDP